MNKVQFLCIFLLFSGIVTQIKSQNVGIGTATPTHKLHVIGTIRSDTLALGTSVPRSPLSFPPVFGQKITLWDDGNAGGANYGIGVQSGLLQIHGNTASDNIGFGFGSSTSFTELMRISGNGNVGIGTSLPFTALHVKSSNLNTAIFDGASPMWITLAENGTNRGYIGSFAGNTGDVDFGTYSGNTGALHLTTSNIPRLTIVNNGNVGIGTASPAASALVDISSNNKGVLIPRLTTAQRAAITNPGTGLLVFDSTSKGFYFFNGIKWAPLLNAQSDTTTETLSLGASGGRVDWIVPPNVYQINVELHGGKGGNALGGSGGAGATVKAAINVTPGQKIYFFLGNKGGNAYWFQGSRVEGIAPFNGGTAPYADINKEQGGGAGATDIRINGMALSNRVLVAGGGGGGLYFKVGGFFSAKGGCGAYPQGCSGDSLLHNYFPHPGHGGTQTNGGINYGVPEYNGSSGQGGTPNGGGGYYGGAGGKEAGGGGGSSWASPSLTNVVYGTSNLNGGGFAKITYVGANPFATAGQVSNLQVNGNITFNQGNIMNEGWKTPALENGWETYSIAGTGFSTPGYYKDAENRVHLRGVLGWGNVPSTLFFLPEGYRPSNNGTLVFPVLSNNLLGRLEIYPNGEVKLIVGSNQSVSLDGISFRAEQ